MSIKTTILSIAIATALYTPQVSLAQEPLVTAKWYTDFIKKRLQSKSLSCIVSSRYPHPLYIDNYRCGKTEDLEKMLPYRQYHPDYPYMVFGVMWYYERGKTIKDASKEEKILYEFGVRLANQKIPKGTPTKEAFIIDDDSKTLWEILEKYTCFRMHNDLTVSKKSCK